MEPMRVTFNMDCFLEAFKLCASKGDNIPPSVLCRSILSPKGQKAVYEAQLAAFSDTCRRLCKLGCYDIILSFMFGAFLHREDYDLEVLSEKLGRISVGDKYSLANLCADFYKEAQIEHYFLSQPSEKNALRNADLFSITDEIPSLNHNLTIHAYPVMFTLICEKVWGIKIDADNITKSDIDRLVAASRQRVTEEYEENTAYKAEILKSITDFERQHNTKSLTGKPVIEKISVISRDRMLPGILKLAFSVCEYRQLYDLCFYILEEYVLPYLLGFDWTGDDSDPAFFALILRQYNSVFTSLVSKPDAPLAYTAKIHFRSAKQLYMKAVTEKAADEDAAYCKAHVKVFSLFARLVSKARPQLEKAFASREFSRLVASLSYLLCLADETDAATDLLIRHYDRMREADDTRRFVLLVLVKCILKADSLITANTLNGYFCFEEVLYEREIHTMRNLIYETVDFLKSAKEYIKENEQLDIDFKTPIYDMLYGDDRIDSVEQELLACAEQNVIPKKALRIKLDNILIGFQNRAGIDLGRFGYNRGDDFSQYISGGLSESLRKTASKLYERTDILRNFDNLSALEDFRRNAEIHIESHILEFQKRLVIAHLSRIDDLRHSGLCDDEISDKIIKATESLAAELRPDGYDRTVTERLVRESHNNFCKLFYAEDSNKDLLGGLPFETLNELFNYLITSEMIFRYLSEQEDDSLDFTPALISLTKALEFIMFCAYQKFDTSNTDGVDSSILSHNLLLDKSGVYRKLPHLELGNLVYLLKDGKQIHLNKANRSVYYPDEQKYEVSHFNKWNNGVFNIAELRRFTSLDITVSDYPDKTRPYTVHFVTGENADDINRAILAKAIEYIKDNYRNPAAHKDRMQKSAVTACRELMLSSEQLLWILLAIIDFSKPDTLS